MTCETQCPSVDVVARPFDPPDVAVDAARAGAHLFIVGDSTNKLLHMSFCNQYLPRAERCSYGCSTPMPAQYPINAQPYLGFDTLCPECDARGAPCCAPGTDVCCANESQFRTAVACRPRRYTSGEGSAGFLMVMGSHPTAPYFQPPPPSPGLSMYQGYDLAVDTEQRIAVALPAFIAWAERGKQAFRRPIVTLLNSCIWTIWKFSGRDPGFDSAAARRHDSALVREFEADMEAMAQQVRGIYHAADHAESAECVVFQTNLQAVAFPEYVQLASSVGLMSTLNKAIVRVGEKLNIPVFDMAGAAASLSLDSTFLEDGYHPHAEVTMQTARLFKMWANEKLPSHCTMTA